MLVLFAIFWPLVISETYGSPISDPFYDDPQASATDVINKINEVEDIDGNFFEGDILVDPKDPTHGGILRKKRNARRLRSFVWQSKIIPYEISTELVGDGYEPTILSAIEEFSKHTCIKWKPHVNEPRWVKFVKDRGCFSSVGVNFWKTGSQVISLGNGCNHKGVTMHEMMHAAGFWHEQSRYDRDKYVEILWENIETNKDHNFKKYDLREIDYLNEVYDTDSIMHYGKTSFSKNGKPTILALGDPSKPLGQRNGFSQTDIAQLNALYDCAGSSSGWSSWTAFGPCDDRCMHVRQRFCASADLANCPGAHPYYHTQRDEQKCPDSKCYAPVNGHWGRWSAWSSCSVTCNKGKHSRTRKCDEPSPKNGGKDCPGNNLDVGDCEKIRCALGPYDCEFEAGGMCGWTFCNQPNNAPAWFRHSGATTSIGTGPKEDHTSGSGNYVYFEASSPAQPGQTACFSSPLITARACRRLIFWYHMLGSGIGQLKVLVGDIVLWSRSGEQGDKWIQASVEIRMDKEMQIKFEGTRGVDFRGDIAVDDISLSDCEAPSTTLPPITTRASTTKQPTTTQPTTTKQSTTPKMTQPSPSTLPPTTSSSVWDSCGFDTGDKCNWTNMASNSANYTWMLHKGATPSKGTGPAGDHSISGQGGYIFLDASKATKESKAHLISKEFSGASASCLHFWYHMRGDKDGMGYLRVFIQRGKKLRRWRLWVKTKNRGKRWLFKKITVKKHKKNQPFRLIFEGTRGTTVKGDIALDDIKVVAGACSKRRKKAV
ncbi:uncharacterized protein LOC141894391 [Acropora palmata]|uniref:uncharacterized protein LOC141894391 n=1 Tax=Acropora palmata TaxID=6131 RepID=UPI003DA0819B